MDKEMFFFYRNALARNLCGEYSKEFKKDLEDNGSNKGKSESKGTDTKTESSGTKNTESDTKTQSETTPNVEAKKAYIEKRRQEELKKG